MSIRLGDDQRGSQSNPRIPCPHSPNRTFANERTLRTHLQKKHPDPQIVNSQIVNSLNLDPIEDLKIKLGFSKYHVKVLRRIPKSSRFMVADKLCSVLKNCIQKNSVDSWSQVLLFSYMILSVDQDMRKSLNAKIRENILKFSLPARSARPVPDHSSVSLTPTPKLIETKIEDYDIKGAVRILSSTDTVAPFNDETLHLLQDKHPSSTETQNFPDVPCVDSHAVVVSEKTVLQMISSFPHGSSGGIDGFRPQFLKDVTSESAGEAGKRALSVITDFCNFLLSGKVNEIICPFIYGASLLALSKKDGGIRPIAVGNAFRRLTAKLGCNLVKNNVISYLSPNQLGVGVKLGCEASIHALRSYVCHPDNKEKVILKIDFMNAFNCVSRVKMLHQVQDKTPQIYPFLRQCYNSPSFLFFGKNIISSEIGCQQGDPCGPLLFSISVHPIVQNVTSEFNTWYLDDVTLGDKPDIVFENYVKIIEMARAIGLDINPSKCELHFCSDIVDPGIVQIFDSISPGIRITKKSELNLLGAPVYEEGFEHHVQPKVDQIKLLIGGLEKLNAHYGYLLMKNCLLIPKLMYLVRTSPFWLFKNVTSSIDKLLSDALESLFNVNLTDSQLNLATLPIRNGGIGIRKIGDLALPAFISSIHGVQNLVSNILPMDNVSVYLLDEAVDTWRLRFNVIPEPEFLHIQKKWDAISVEHIIQSKIQLSTNIDQARFIALQAKESGAWLHAFPSKSIGTLMDNVSFRTCIALRLGCCIFKKHVCECGTTVSVDGLHGLTCSRGKGRFPRHAELNDIVHRALTSIHIPSTLEPVGLSRDDGKRPDGMSLMPWSRGRMLVWDCTCVNTFAESYLSRTSQVAGSAAEDAARRKNFKYGCIISQNYIFKPLAFETLGPWSMETKKFLRDVGDKLIAASGNPSAHAFLQQRIGIAIQRGNAGSMLSTLPSGSPLVME